MLPNRRRTQVAKGSQLALKGVRVLVGRAKHQAGALSSELRELGATGHGGRLNAALPTS